jgi:hypothetical protein
MSMDPAVQRDVEYQALRDEIIRRIENRYQIIQVTIIGAGSILTIGLKSDDFIPILFIFPIFVLFLASSWAHNGFAHTKLSWYIMTQIEHDEPNKFYYETWSHLGPSSVSGKIREDVLGNAAAAGIFVITQVLSMTFGYLAWTSDTPSVLNYASKNALLGVDVVVVLLTVGVMVATARASWTLRGRATRDERASAPVPDRGLAAAGPEQSEARAEAKSPAPVDASAEQDAADEWRPE